VKKVGVGTFCSSLSVPHDLDFEFLWLDTFSENSRSEYAGDEKSNRQSFHDVTPRPAFYSGRRKRARRARLLALYLCAFCANWVQNQPTPGETAPSIKGAAKGCELLSPVSHAAPTIEQKPHWARPSVNAKFHNPASLPSQCLMASRLNPSVRCHMSLSVTEFERLSLCFAANLLRLRTQISDSGGLASPSIANAVARPITATWATPGKLPNVRACYEIKCGGVAFTFEHKRNKG
jgi:hypothetical protein